MSERRPLADRIRPSSLDAVAGQNHLVGPSGPIRQAIATGNIPSMIFWGPPGVGKTTLARLIATESGRRYFELSAVSAGKDELRGIVAQAAPPKSGGGLFAEEAHSERAPILFLDEIHRFNKAQQDFLLPYVENGTIVLIGATTENPSFEVISALLSRSRVFVLQPLAAEDVQAIVMRAVKDLQANVEPDALDFLVAAADGDGRQAVNLLDNTVGLYGTDVTVEHLKSAMQSRHVRYDKKAEEHYNTISAFIKSMRASNANAALYYLARMIEAGEDPKFIARRMVIFASEDVGLADPNALAVANAVFRAVESIGYPECSINLGHGVAYLARAPKNRDAYDGIMSALAEVKESGSLPTPLKLRNARTQLMKEVGYGEDYEMYDKGDLLPEAIRGKRFLPENPGL